MEIEPKNIVAGIFLVLLWAGEGVLPFYPEFPEGMRRKVGHDARNLAVGAGNALLMAVLFGAVFVAVEVWAEDRSVGLLRILDAPGWLALGLAILLFDLWMYLWHRANHRIPFLWRFHRMHHSDPEMDVSTGLRFHPGEMVLSSIARLAVLPLLGMSLWHLAIYEVLLLPVILFHHSNLRIPRWMDHGLLAVIVTPAMHRVHHSRWQPETDSNYGSILPWWDMIFRSFRLREDARTIHLGLEEFDEDRWQTLGGMLRTPLRGSEPDPAGEARNGTTSGDREEF
jgi:sterol desaturase/sphingolipid hydroxylase (fatty acid hydroxylase superfamily)